MAVPEPPPQRRAVGLARPRPRVELAGDQAAPAAVDVDERGGVPVAPGRVFGLAARPHRCVVAGRLDRAGGRQGAFPVVRVSRLGAAAEDPDEEPPDLFSLVGGARRGLPEGDHFGRRYLAPEVFQRRHVVWVGACLHREDLVDGPCSLHVKPVFLRGREDGFFELHCCFADGHSRGLSCRFSQSRLKHANHARA